jgi:membrane-associated phospholipid phosphatase
MRGTPPEPRRPHVPTRLLIAGMAGSALVFLVATVVMADGSFDLATRSFIADVRGSIPASLDDGLWVVSKVLEKSTGAVASFVVAAGVGVYLAVTRRDVRPGAVLVATVFGVLMLTIVLKDVFDRPAPLEWSRGEPTGRAFPSGHAAQALAVWGLVALFWQRAHGDGTRLLVPIALGLAVVATGLSRLVLDAHWSTDVVAGWGLGGFVLCLALVLGEFLPLQSWAERVPLGADERGEPDRARSDGPRHRA